MPSAWHLFAYLLGGLIGSNDQHTHPKVCCPSLRLLSCARSVQDTPLPYSAGMLSYASFFTIPPRKKQHFVLNSCCYRGFQPLTSFAVRVHTHTLGREVFMTRAPPTKKGEWSVWI